MSRLTMKLDEPIKTKYLNYEYNRIPDYDIVRGNFGRISDDMIFNKLGRLEDLEDELGCPLDVVTSKTAMVVKNNEIYDVDIMAVSFTNGNIYFGSEWSFTTRKLKDYKKTWWLRSDLKEE